MVLKQLDIYPKNYHEPDISMTYTTDKKGYIEMFKMWLSNECKDNMEIIDIANKLYYEIIMNNNSRPHERDIHIAYQVLYHDKQWKEKRELTTKINVESLLTKAPHNNYIELTKDYLSESYEKIYNKYLKKYNNKEKRKNESI